jgi:hypothetical protein
MFETLEDAFEKSKPPLDRGWPILLYGGYVVLSSIALTLGVRRHGFHHPFSLAVWAAMFSLSLIGLVTSLRIFRPNSPPRFRDSQQHPAFAPDGTGPTVHMAMTAVIRHFHALSCKVGF